MNYELLEEVSLFTLYPHRPFFVQLGSALQSDGLNEMDAEIMVDLAALSICELALLQKNIFSKMWQIFSSVLKSFL